MFDIGFWELITIAIIALLVIGPERLPGAAVEAGKWIGHLRGMVRSLRHEIEKEMRLGESGNLTERIVNLERLLEDAPDRKQPGSPDNK